MTAKDIVFDSGARAHIGGGLDALANAVMVTLGPRGRIQNAAPVAARLLTTAVVVAVHSAADADPASA